MAKRVEIEDDSGGVESAMVEQLIHYTFELDTLSSDRLGQLKSTMKAVQ